MATRKIQPESIVIGQRITFGGIVGGAVSFGCWLWNARNPDTPIPAEQAVILTTLFTGIGQVVIVNYLGLTVPE